MATTYTWSTTNAGTYAFDPATDDLIFDGGISAADVLFASDGITSTFTYGGKTITFNTSPFAFEANTNITFNDGSLLLIGDNTTGTANDNAANTLSGGSGDDMIIGAGGADSLVGNGGDDIFPILTGGTGTYGNDTIDGGAGVDVITFVDDTGYGINVNLGNATTNGSASGGDSIGSSITLIGIEGVIGTPYNDTFSTSGGDFGGTFDEVFAYFEGMQGNDTLNNIRTAYDHSPYGVVVNLSSGSISGDFYGAGVIAVNSRTARDGWDSVGGGTDTLSNPFFFGGGLIDARGSQFNDTLIGGDFDDNWFEGQGGDDYIDGRGNITDDNDDPDTVEYLHATGAVYVNLGLGTAYGIDGGDVANIGEDTLVGIEHVLGSDFNDSLVGGGQGEVIAQELGWYWEAFNGMAGNDTLNGGDTVAGAIDIALYFGDPSGVIVNLSSSSVVVGSETVAGGTARDGFGGTDTLVNMNGAIGSFSNDTLVGGDDDDWFEGVVGNDSIVGGAGADTVFFDSHDVSSGVIVNLSLSGVVVGGDTVASGTARDGLGGTDVLDSIEHAWGTEFSDYLAGNAAPNLLIGEHGNDTIDGGPTSGAGNDTLAGDDGTDLVIFASATAGVTADLGGAVYAVSGYDGTGLIFEFENFIGSPFDDYVLGGTGPNTLDGRAGNDTLDGGGAFDNGNDVLIGGSGNDTLIQTKGSDVLDGGDGSDTLAFNDGVGGGATVNLATQTSSHGPAFAALSSIENVTGTGGNDSVLGSAAANRLSGQGGNDTLDGGGPSDTANDTLLGGDGNDRLVMTRGSDYIDGGSGTGFGDSLQFGTGLGNGVNVNLAAHTATQGSHTATVLDVEQVIGTAANDNFTGGDPLHAPGISLTTAELFQPLGGNDTITGMTGNGWQTVVDYSTNTTIQPVVVTLGNGNNIGTANDGQGGIDTLLNVDRALGGAGNDLLVGGSRATTSNGIFLEAFRGNAGNDTLDGGGSDTVLGAYGVLDRAEYFNSPGPVVVNIGIDPWGSTAGGTASDGWGGTDTLIDIDWVQGSNFNDTLIGGNPAFDSFERFEGRGGNDFIYGRNGFNEADYSGSPAGVVVNLQQGTAADGFGGTDTLFAISFARGSDFNDTLIGGQIDGFDIPIRLTGGPGNDYIDGGTNGGLIATEENFTAKFASYSTSNQGVYASISGGTGTASDGFGGTDTLVNINGLWGSTSNDTLIGGDGDQWFHGFAGSDTIDGGAGNDVADYWFSPAGVTVNLATGTASDGWGGVWGMLGNDTLTSIEGVYGSQFADHITGSAGDNGFVGGDGNDTIIGGLGIDFVLYGEYPSLTPPGVTVNLGTGTATDSWGATDTLSQIEDVWGSGGDDSIVGNSGANLLKGLDGDDTLDGGGTADTGDDTLIGGAGDDRLVQTKGADSIVGAEGTDTLSFNDSVAGGVNVNLATHASTHGANTATLVSIEQVVGTTSNDTFTGGDAEHAPALGNNGVTEFFQPLGGNDVITGAAGDGWITGVDYGTNTSGQPVTVVLGNGNNTGSVTDGLGGTDTLVNVDWVEGGAGNDTLVGGSLSTGADGVYFESFLGGVGNDSIDGGGSDTTIGAAGRDRADYETSPFAVVANMGTTAVTGTPYGTVSAGTARDGYDVAGGGTDTLIDIDWLRGGNQGDTLVGGNTAHDNEERYEGGAGNDSLVGGSGTDTLIYDDSPTRVIVNLFGSSTINVSGDTVPGNSVRDGWGGTDTISGMENVIGSAFNDYVQGGSNTANRFEGGDGNDTLIGGGGQETLAGAHLNDTLLGGAGNDRLIQTHGNEYIDGGDGTGDRLEFASNNFVYGGANGVNVNLAAGTSNADPNDGDTVNGAGGDTAYITGIEFVVGTIGNDVFTGGDPLHQATAGFDGVGETFRPLGGNDTINGGAGLGWYTSVDYSTSGSPVTAVLGNSNNSGTASDGFGGTDTLLDIDEVRGGSGNDSLVGGSYSINMSGVFIETFVGNAGNDTMDGQGSDTTIDIHGVTNRVDYGGSSFGVVVNLGTTTLTGNFYGTEFIKVGGGTARDGFSSTGGGTDTLRNMNVVRGSGFDDTLVGGNSRFDNHERFEGRGGDDLFIGGSGSDEADYSASPAGVVVNLALGTASDGFGGTDTFHSIERARGGDFDDTLIGGANEREVLAGRGGNDYIDGGSMTGVNYASFQNGTEAASASIAGGTGTATADGLGGADVLVNINGLMGTSFDDTLTGGAGDQWFNGRGGGDLITGGADTDTVSYRGDPNGVSVNLGGAALDGWGGIWQLQGTDTLSGIENVEGSSLNDTITGDNGANLLDGREGDDTLDGGGTSDTGNDTLLGGDGDDWLVQTNGNDWIDGGAGEDVLSFNDTQVGGVNVNLAAGTSTHGTNTATVSGIEAVIGTSSADTLAGGDPLHAPDTASGANGAAEFFLPLGGNDTITGAAGDGWITYVDYETNTNVQPVTVVLGTGTLAGSANDGLVGTDVLVNVDGVIGGAGNDSLAGGSLSKGADGVYFESFRGEAGNDTLNGAGSDTTVGAAGRDRADYETSQYGVVANMGTADVIGDFYGAGTDTVAGGTALDGFDSVGGGTDTLIAIDWLRGSDQADTLVGGNAAHDNEERYEGGAGNDSLVGGSGTDTLIYDDSPTRVIVNMFGTSTITVSGDTVPGNTVRDGWGTSDTIDGMENVVGSAFNDYIQGGSNSANRFEGGAGDDTLIGGGGQETLAGAHLNDTLLGGAGNDRLIQTHGNEYIDGGDGTNDRLEFASNNFVYGGANGVNVNLAAGTSDADPSNADTVNGAGGDVATISGIEFVFGTAGNDYFAGGDPLHALNAAGDRITEIFRGNAGNDTISGAAGTGWFTTADYNSSQPVTVTLGNSGNEGWASDGQGGTDTLVNVDRAVGGSGNDFLVGGSYATAGNGVFFESFRGNAGNDTIDGSGSDATVAVRGSLDRVEYSNSAFPVVVNLGTVSFSGNYYGTGTITVNGGTARDGTSSTGGGTDILRNIDWVQGSNFDDILVGGNAKFDNHERFAGQGGNDTIDGGSGYDEADYTASTEAVTVNLALGTASDGQGGTDALVNIEYVRGGDFNDTLIGSDATSVQRFTGDAGNDYIDGAGGGVDFVGFYVSPTGVSATLVNGSGSAPDGVGGTDTYVNIEGLLGSNHADTLTGGDGDQWFNGWGGNDSLTGGAGNDWVTYFTDPLGVLVNLGANTATDGWGGLWAMQGTDTLFGIENVEGSPGDDSIVGDSGNNQLVGLEGHDTLAGGGGNDTMTGGAGNDVYLVEDAGDLVIEAAGEGIDTIYTTVGLTIPDNIENVIFIGAGGGSITGNTLDNVVSGYIGNDTLDGADGIDTASYQYEAGAVTVDLEAGTATGSGTDTLTRFENAEGGAANDTLTGSIGANILDGGPGADSMTGGPGSDTYYVNDIGDIVNETSNASGGLLLPGGGGSFKPGLLGGVFDSITDTIVAAIDYSLQNLIYIERIALTGDATTATGNELDNTIEGNQLANLLAGLGGNDTVGGLGGDDTLTGGLGVDSLIGGGGNDLHVVSATPTVAAAKLVFVPDAVSEIAGEGVDTITSSSSYTLPDNVENLILTGGSYWRALVGAGNDGDNAITGQGAGRHQLYGNGGDDTLEGGSGKDTLDGGTGIDTAAYSGAGAAVDVNLASGNASGSASGTDTLISIEVVLGSGFGDTLTGSGNADALDGGAGDDTLDGGAGEDTLVGGAGNDSLVGGADSDTVDYSGATFGVYVNLAGSNANGSELGTDTLSGIENVLGSGSFDTLNGDANANVLNGGAENDYLFGDAGNDTLIGGTGFDTLDGGADIDTVDYSGATAAVNVNIGIGMANSGFTDNDGLSNIENAVGSAFADTLNGDGNANVLDGGAGNDNLWGDAGNDTLIGGAGNDMLDGGNGDDVLVYDAADASINGNADTDTLRIDGSGVVLDLNFMPDNIIQDMEVINLTGTGDNTLSLALSDVLAISNSTDTLTIDGDAGDTVNAGTGWFDAGTEVNPGYHTWTQGLATLLIDTDVTQNVAP